MTHQSRASGLATGIISRRPGAQSSIEASFLFPSRGASEPVILSAEGAKDLPVGSLDTSSTIRSPISRVPSTGSPGAAMSLVRAPPASAARTAASTASAAWPSPSPCRSSIAADAMAPMGFATPRSEEHTSELQSRLHLVCRLLLEKKKDNDATTAYAPAVEDD